MPTSGEQGIGMPEPRLRHRLEEELLLTTRSATDVPTVQAVAHAFARVLSEDHAVIAGQLARARLTIVDDAEA